MKEYRGNIVNGRKDESNYKMEERILQRKENKECQKKMKNIKKKNKQKMKEGK